MFQQYDLYDLHGLRKKETMLISLSGHMPIYYRPRRSGYDSLGTKRGYKTLALKGLTSFDSPFIQSIYWSRSRSFGAYALVSQTWLLFSSL